MTRAADDPIGVAQSTREVNELSARADTLSRDHPAGPDIVADAWQAVLDHPFAHHQVDQAEVFDALHQALRRAGRWVDAIDAKRSAIDAGYRSLPHPEADFAEILIAAGRNDEATVLYETLRERDPDEVWLYNSAAFSWTGVDDPVALRWVYDGIDVAIATGDPDRVIGQLLDFTHTIWDRPLGWDQKPDPPGPCGHCGYRPDHPPDPEPDVARAVRTLNPDDPEVAASGQNCPPETGPDPGGGRLVPGW